MHHSAQRSGRAPAHRQHRKRNRAWWLVVGLLLVILLGAAAWVGTRALMAKSDLDAALLLVPQIKTQILAGDSGAAMKTVSVAAAKVRDAKNLTSDPVWRIAEIIPVAGSNLRNVRELTDIADGIFVDAVTPLSSVAKTFKPESLKPKDGAIDVAPFVAAKPAVVKATKAVLTAQKRMRALDTSGSISQVKVGAQKFSTMIDGIVPQLQLANKALKILPDLLGESAPRHYLLLFQNNAEPRALGGTAGAMVLVTVDKGHIQLGQQASTRDFPHYGGPVIPASEERIAIYGSGIATDALSVTSTPSFSQAAKAIQAMWASQFGTSFDGVASIDPIALGYILKATGPIKLATGDTLTSDNAASMLLNGVYQRYPALTNADNIKQDAFFGAAVSATFERVTGGGFDPAVFMKVLLQGLNEHRLSFWSGNAQEQEVISTVGLTPEAPVSDATHERAGLYIGDAVGSKLEYYLTQKVAVTQGVCRADGRETYRVGIDLTSSIPANPEKTIPAYILGEWKRERTVPGNMRLDVMTYAPTGSTIVGMSVDGKAVDPGTLRDGANPVALVRTPEIAPGATLNVTFEFVGAKPGTKALDLTVTPLVHPTPITKAAIDCGSVAKE